MQPALRTALLAGLTVIIALLLILAAGAADSRMTTSDTCAWLIIPGIGSVAIIVMAAILYASLRLVKGFHDSSSSLIDTLRALTPMPVVTLSGEIPAGVDGRLEMRIRGFTSVPFGQVTVILSPPQGLVLKEEHIVLTRLEPDETKSIWIAHGPAPKGRHVVGVTVLYRAGDREMVREFTRTVSAGIPADPETIN
ncbi:MULTISPECIES: hypothetical protein [unclassified Methanoregula]|uniref:hypothetical protein n=1 Tax=unclassified Methanoregula TaxID=2649730 RepID=UPI0009D35D39|nr:MULTISPECIES: hypothetical protein [unclassified Methanoregula]OPX64186.1 MAG: hypothetical protein A4E33_01213 [Methanoregula sp. PtaB.Bin085]OPY34694.1 MAG: hypothetical protein A4E34_01220 [Methanoregula sp. PtaU1.Bin006]